MAGTVLSSSVSLEADKIAVDRASKIVEFARMIARRMRLTKSKNRERIGVTLIELLVVIAIIGVLELNL